MIATIAGCGLTLALGAGVAHGEDRTINGYGNNEDNPTWGQAGTQLLRLAPSDYADGVSTPSGAGRENPRTISNTLASQSGSMPNTGKLSSWVFQWGQFIDHDMSLTDTASPSEPWNVPIPTGDPLFDGSMPFSRSNYDADTGTGPDNPRQQVNSITAYLDASMVYGSDQVRADALRTEGGHLKTSAGDMLPYNTLNLPNADNGDPNRSNYYLAGDVRVNEQVGLIGVQTLFVREHNRLADLIADVHDDWSDDQIYQRARRIVGAEVQAITFNEFLPALLGTQNAPGTASTYNPTVDASIANEFTTALFRVGHTMLNPELARMQNDGTPIPEGPMPLRDAFFRPDAMASNADLECILMGLVMYQQQQIDIHVVDDVRNFLFGPPGTGFDLATLNIQRGRDHGLADYNTLRTAYGLPTATSFADITSDVALQTALAAMYGDVDNVDAWVGALCEDLSENLFPGAQVGPLIAAGMIDQFTRLRDGDSFWYLNDTEFTPEEMQWLASVRLSDIISLNTGLTNLPENVFFVIPEPSSQLLAVTALLGFAAAGFARRRRRLCR